MLVDFEGPLSPSNADTSPAPTSPAASYDAIAMYETGHLEPGWRMLQRGTPGGTNLCPRHAPTVTSDGATLLHAPEALDRDTGATRLILMLWWPSGGGVARWWGSLSTSPP